MKVRPVRVATSPKLMIIPMIDIIFFLLVFFMVSALQMVHQKTLPVNLPKASTVQSDMTKPLAITVHQDGRLSVDETNVSLEGLAAMVKSVTANQPDLGVIIRADKKTEHGNIVNIIDLLKSVGVAKLAIAAEEKTP